MPLPIDYHHRCEGLSTGPALSIATLAKWSASLLFSRRTCTTSQLWNCGSRLWTTRSRRFASSGSWACQRPFTCITTSLESPCTEMVRMLLSRAIWRPRMSPSYSARLLVVCPRNAELDVMVLLCGTLKTAAPQPPGPGFPRDPPSKNYICATVRTCESCNS